MTGPQPTPPPTPDPPGAGGGTRPPQDPPDDPLMTPAEADYLIDVIPVDDCTPERIRRELDAYRRRNHP